MLRLEKLANDKGFKIYQYSDSSDTINDAFDDMGCDESPIIADVLLQIKMVKLYSPLKITECVKKYVGIRLFILCTFHSNDDILGTQPQYLYRVYRESKNIITPTFTSQENGRCE
ncbi:uncharacterized protein EV154DRAFT_483556 [Mucor mucedo]|uniref:uncharacterized protein n=1 Tax=Mucor mucedo TaxID=29922 RepID=UPI00221F041D|nr:uncharacterized protein EV154DRAFT_483556 [Mucor mucedo]KAI7889019.1 hypothetical protein EV154DRAFT_483556 [Mucor mucedo]